jgi:hypothetical protein
MTYYMSFMVNHVGDTIQQREYPTKSYKLVTIGLHFTRMLSSIILTMMSVKGWEDPQKEMKFPYNPKSHLDLLISGVCTLFGLLTLL